jgi:gamma-glutamylaminecyclotransferase
MARRHLVFVYGTLMQGEHHHDQLAGAEFVGPRSTRAQYELVQVDYFPAMLLGGHTRVLGELYAVDEATLARLDELEEVPHYYVRESIELSDDTRADTYLLPRERAGDARPIPSGSFRDRRE